MENLRMMEGQITQAYGRQVPEAAFSLFLFDLTQIFRSPEFKAPKMKYNRHDMKSACAFYSEWKNFEYDPLHEVLREYVIQNPDIEIVVTLRTPDPEVYQSYRYRERDVVIVSSRKTTAH